MAGFNEEALSRRIRAAQRAAVSAGQRLGREAIQASQGASAIEAGKFSAARGLGGTDLEGALRGSITAGSARELADAEARRKASLLDKVKGIGTAMLAEESASASRRAEEKLMRASEGGSFAALLGGLGGTAMGLAAIPSIASVPLAIGGAIGSAIGGVGGFASGGEAAKAKKALSDIQGQVADFDMPGTEGYASMLTGPGYEGWIDRSLGAFGGRKRKRKPEDELAADPIYFGS
jgi:hypothetical protein